jgi:hypothetical protein
MEETDDRVVGVARLADAGDRDEAAANGEPEEEDGE